MLISAPADNVDLTDRLRKGIEIIAPTVTDTLKVVITGAGKLTYSGNPATIKKQITGAGSIRHKD